MWVRESADPLAVIAGIQTHQAGPLLTPHALQLFTPLQVSCCRS